MNRVINVNYKKEYIEEDKKNNLNNDIIITNKNKKIKIVNDKNVSINVNSYENIRKIILEQNK
jgi:hypothetical protein